jgi:hypothetical protein
VVGRREGAFGGVAEGKSALAADQDLRSQMVRIGVRMQSDVQRESGHGASAQVPFPIPYLGSCPCREPLRVFPYPALGVNPLAAESLVVGNSPSEAVCYRD